MCVGRYVCVGGGVAGCVGAWRGVCTCETCTTMTGVVGACVGVAEGSSVSPVWLGRKLGATVGAWVGDGVFGLVVGWVDG